jgi:hypothetical protein
MNRNPNTGRSVKAGYVINPNTGNTVQVGGPTYKQLVRQGVITAQSQTKADGDWDRRGKHMAGMYEEGNDQDYELGDDEETVVNPNTGRKIKKTGSTYRNLVKSGELPAVSYKGNLGQSPKSKVSRNALTKSGYQRNLPAAEYEEGGVTDMEDAYADLPINEYDLPSIHDDEDDTRLTQRQAMSAYRGKLRASKNDMDAGSFQDGDEMEPEMDRYDRRGFRGDWAIRGPGYYGPRPLPYWY